MKIDILVLNYNGKDLLEEYLPSICEAAGRSHHEAKVHVVDNKSTDDSVSFLKDKFPEVEVHVASENRILCSYNEVVDSLDSDIIIFLNNDIRVDADFIDPLSGHFSENNVMFVAPRVMNFDNTYNGGKSFLKFKYGAIKVVVDYDHFESPGDTQAISCGAFRRNEFLGFGGFDDLYLPGIWEDVDLCFRALSQGWKGIYEPKSIVWHKESTTFHREYGEKKKMRIAHRNMFLFFWKNITDVRMFISHVLLTPPRVIVQFFMGKGEILEGLFMAMGRIPLVLKKRKYLKKDRNKRVLVDRRLII